MSQSYELLNDNQVAEQRGLAGARGSVDREHRRALIADDRVHRELLADDKRPLQVGRPAPGREAARAGSLGEQVPVALLAEVNSLGVGQRAR
jgi:hypothetical protein